MYCSLILLEFDCETVDIEANWIVKCFDFLERMIQLYFTKQISCSPNFFVRIVLYILLLHWKANTVFPSRYCSSWASLKNLVACSAGKSLDFSSHILQLTRQESNSLDICWYQHFILSPNNSLNERFLDLSYSMELLEEYHHFQFSFCADFALL